MSVRVRQPRLSDELSRRRDWTYHDASLQAPDRKRLQSVALVASRRSRSVGLQDSRTPGLRGQGSVNYWEVVK